MTASLPTRLLLALALVLTLALPVRAEAPLGLEGTDGQGLTLERLAVRVAMHGPLSLTELDMVFRNPLDRQMEGKFRCTLPVGAAISRFAKEVDGKLMEGEVLERKKAARVYTEILHTMRDPALLEADAGNLFTARIFPIAPRATVRLVLSYGRTTPVGPDGTRTIVLPLQGLPTVGQLDVVAVARPFPGEAVEMTDATGALRPMKRRSDVVFADEASGRNVTPTHDAVFSFRPGADASRATVLRAGDFQMLAFRPDLPASPATGDPTAWTVAIDTSASAALNAETRLAMIREVLSGLAARVPGAAMDLRAFDQRPLTLSRWRADGPGLDDAMTALRSRRFLGGTDLATAAGVLGEEARKTRDRRVFVMVTDGVPTFGTKEPGDIVRRLGEWPPRHTLHVLVLGSAEEPRVTEALAEAGGGRVVRLPMTQGWQDEVGETVARLARPVGATVTVFDEAAEWLEPATFRDVEAGSELVAFARIAAGKASAPGWTCRGAGSDRLPVRELSAPAAFTPLLEREAYRARIAQIERLLRDTQDATRRRSLEDEMLRISVEHRVLCPLTSLLVLETEADYVRFGIARHALADILVVGDDGIELLHRATPPPPTPTPAVVRPRQEEAQKMKSARAAGNGGRNGGDHGETAPSAGAPAAGPRDLNLSDDEDSFADEGGGGDTGAVDALAAPSPVDARLDESFGGAAEAPAEERVADRESASEPVERRVMARPSVSAAAPPPPPAPARAPSPELRPQGSNALVTSDEMSITGGTGSAGERMAPPAAVPVSSPAPGWVADATFRPDDELLGRLAAAVAKEPQDRRRRNAYCWALGRARKPAELLAQALDWQRFDSGNPMVYEFIGDALDALGKDDDALRAYGSIAEVAPGDSGLLNRAGYLLLRAGLPEEAETLFRFAIERRPDHHNNYRGLALALWYRGRHEEAAGVLVDCLALDFHERYRNLKRVIREELGYILDAWLVAKPGDRGRVEELARRQGVRLDRSDDLRISLHWETDANDVDLHVVDPDGEECYYSHKNNRSGLELYEDLTQGLGPEVTVVPRGRMLKGVYHVGVKYFSAGPMGVSRGVVVIQQPGPGALPRMDIHPFCLLPDLEGRAQDMRHLAVVEK